MATKPAPKPAAPPESEDVLMLAFYRQNPKALRELEEHVKGSAARCAEILGRPLPVATLPPEAAPAPAPPSSPAWTKGLGPQPAEPAPLPKYEPPDWSYPKRGEPARIIPGIAQATRPPTREQVQAAAEAHRKSQPRFGPGAPPPIVPDVPAAAKQAVPLRAFDDTGRFPVLGRAPVSPRDIVARNPNLVEMPAVVREIVLQELGQTGSAAVATMHQLKGWLGTPGMTRQGLLELARAGLNKGS